MNPIKILIIVFFIIMSVFFALSQSLPGRNIKSLALTFDDGPDGLITDSILDVLEKYNVKATFFLVGERMLKYPEQVRRIYSQGHELGIHSFSHDNYSTLSDEEVLSDIKKTQQVFLKMLNIRPHIIRPPFGKMKEERMDFLNANGFSVVNWSVDSYDWDSKQNSVEAIVSRVKKYAHDEGIILMHILPYGGSGPHQNDGNATVKSLEGILKYFIQRKVKFKTVSELLNIPVET